MSDRSSPLVYLSGAMIDAYREAIAQAVPGARLVELGPDGQPPGPVEAEAASRGVLLISYDFFLAFRDNPDLADNLARLAADCAWVQAGSAGADDSLLHQIRNRSRRYCNAAGLHAVPISQYVFAQLLSWHRRLDLHLEQQRQKLWRPFMVDCELTGKTLGILGYGGIGAEVARLGQAFGMRTLGWRRNPQPDQWADEILSGSTGLDRVLAESHCLVCCLPHSDQTENLLDESRLRKLQPGAVLVNVGRGSLLDEDALARLLAEEHIAFAALDTTSQEPLPPESPLWSAANCHITPHDSAWSPLAANRLRDLFCENLARFASDQPLRNEESTT